MAFKKPKASADDRVQEALNRLSSAKEVVYDSETTGLSWQKCAVVGHVLTFGPAPQDSYYLPVRHGGGGNVCNYPAISSWDAWKGDILPIEKKLMAVLDRTDLLVIGHNLSFDLRFLWRLGFQLRPRFEDTIINEPLLDEWVGHYSLEACANRHGVQAKKSAEIVTYIISLFPEVAKTPKQVMGHFWRLAGDDSMVVEYATGDGTSTWQLRDAQMKRILTKDHDGFDLSLVHSIESRLIPVLARMSAFGVKVNEERLDWLFKHVDQEIEQAMSKFPSGFNIRSPNDVRSYMERAGHTDWPMTTGGTKGKPQPSMREDWLSNYAAGQQIVKVRKYETLKSTFMLPLRDRHVHNGRVHTSFNQLRGDEYGTVTGRLSSSEPNLQAIPAHNQVIAKLFKSVFIPDPGKIWSHKDYSQLEPRLLAYYSRCKALIDGYLANPPLDAHTSASMAANKNWPNMAKEERKAYRDNIGKRINQTVISGGGKKALVTKYKVPEGEVDKLWNDYFRAMPEIRVLQKRSAAVFRQRGFIRSLLGRRARLNDDRDYTAINRLLQCGNADLMKLKLVECDEYLASVGRPIDLLNTVHDAVEMQYAKGNEKHHQELLRIMTDFSPGQVIELDIPITIDGGEGTSWGEAQHGDH